MPDNICTECINWKVECTHKAAKRKRGPKAGKPRIRPSDADKAKIDSLVSSILENVDEYTLPEDLEAVRTMIIDLAVHIRILESQSQSTQVADSSTVSISSTATSSPSCSADTHFAPSSSSSKSKSPADDSDTDLDAEPEDPDVDALADSYTVWRLNHSQKRHFGSSSTFELVRNALNIRSELESTGKKQELQISVGRAKRKEFWTAGPWQAYPPNSDPPYVFPEPDLITNLISLYFIKLNPYFPMLHRPSIEKSFAEGLHLTDRAFGGLLLMVCSLASQHSDDPRTLYEGTESEHSRGWKYFRQIRIIHGSFEEAPSLYELQLYPLAVFYLHTSNVASSAYFLIAMGLRTANQRGVHERQFCVKDNPVETELWKRAFWALIVFDIYGSTSLGRPRSTATDDFDVDFPQECDDEFWFDERKADGVEKLNSDSASGATFAQPIGKPSIVSFWVHYLKLWDIISFALRTLYSVRDSQLGDGMGISAQEWNRKAVIELDSALNSWVDAIPEHLRWDPRRENEIFFHQSVMLYSLYYWAQFQVHKTFIPQAGGGAGAGQAAFDQNLSTISTFPSLAICANAARSCIHVLEVQHRRQPFVPLPMCIPSLFDSAIVLLMNLWRGLRASTVVNPSKEMEDVHKCIGMLGMYEKRYQVGGRLCDILCSIIQAGQPPAPQTSKRARNSDLTSDKAPEHGFGSGAEPADEVYRRYTGSHRHRVVEPEPDTQIPAHQALPTNSDPVSLSQMDWTNENSHFVQDPVNYNSYDTLPYHSHELGTLPLHGSYFDPTFYGAGAGTAPTAGFWDQDQSSHEDWNQFMTGIDTLLESIDQTSFPVDPALTTL